MVARRATAEEEPGLETAVEEVALARVAAMARAKEMALVQPEQVVVVML